VADKTYTCRVNGQGGLTLPAPLFEQMRRGGITCLDARLIEGRPVLVPLEKTAAGIARLSPVLALLEADLASARTMTLADFGVTSVSVFPIYLDMPISGTVTV
jgi:hypothetical protein